MAIAPAALDAELVAELRRKLEKSSGAIASALSTLDRLVDSPETLAHLAQIQILRSRYTDASARVLTLMDRGDCQGASRLVDKEMLPILDEIQSPARSLLELQMKHLAPQDIGARHRLDSALTLLKTLDGAPAAIWRSGPG